MDLGQLLKASLQISQMIEADLEMLQDFHDFARDYGCPLGENVYKFALRYAPAHKGMELETFRAVHRR